MVFLIGYLLQLIIEMSVKYMLFQLESEDFPNSWNLSNTTNDQPQNTSAELNLPSLLLTVLIIWTFFGNMLVLIAVYRERGLKSMSNYVIASLALADLLLAVLVMPLGLVSLVSTFLFITSFLFHLYILLRFAHKSHSIHSS